VVLVVKVPHDQLTMRGVVRLGVPQDVVIICTEGGPVLGNFGHERIR
jgi:hypothetical protein